MQICKITAFSKLYLSKVLLNPIGGRNVTVDNNYYKYTLNNSGKTVNYWTGGHKI